MKKTLYFLFLSAIAFCFYCCEDPNKIPDTINITEDTTICYSDEIVWHNQIVNKDYDTYYDTIRNKNNTYDSVYYTLYVTVLGEEVLNITENMTIRSIDTVVWHDKKIDASTLTYYDTVYYQNTNCDSAYYQLNITVIEYYDLQATGYADGHGYVDLGLSVPWATCNLGATEPIQIGQHYSWATTNPYNASTSNQYDYNLNPCDEIGILSAEYDAISKNWGDSWRMPTKDELKELKDNCTWTWVTNINETNVSGYIITSNKNGNRIFLPAGGIYQNGSSTLSYENQGYYWTSQNYSSSKAIDLMLKSNNYQYIEEKDKAYGLTIRGVVAPANKPQSYTFDATGYADGHGYVDLGLSVPWATCNLGATEPTQIGQHYSWATTTPYNASAEYYYNIDTYTMDDVLSAKFDAISTNWSHSWRTPTQQEFKELKDNCTWKWVDKINAMNVSGYIVTSKINGKSIFLPAGACYEYGDYNLSSEGQGFYWTSEISAGDVTTSGSAVGLVIKSNNYQILEVKSKGNGLTIRGVLAPANEENLDFTPSGTKDGHAYVDLGLSVPWATCNLGASTQEEVGDYYAWQETTPVNNLTYINYQLNFNPCTPDNILSSKYDAARMNWGKEWRMPTYKEQEELCNNCKWKFVQDFQGTGISGCIIRSKSSHKAIFLPVTGMYTHDSQKVIQTDRGYYWSSYLGPGDAWNGIISAMALTFYPGLNFKYGGTWDASHRSAGLAIRPVVGKAEEYIPEGPFPLDETETAAQGASVSGKKAGYTYVDLGLPSRTLWATYNVGGNKPQDYGNFYAWGETTTKDYYGHENYKFHDGMNGRWYRYSKYTWSKEHHGTIDGKFILEPEDDAATQNMGADWCMPTRAQFEELCKYVRFEDYSGTLPYYLGTSKTNGNTIIIPKAGWEYENTPHTYNYVWYWSSELMEANASGSDYYSYMLIDSPTGGLMVKDAQRVQGLAVRAVVKKQ